jgi:tetratricopeptide (TPR) repeat protein
MNEIEELPASRLTPVLRAGLVRHSRGRLLEAAECYRQACAADPDHAEALLLLGILARQAGQFRAAIGLIARAAERQPQAGYIHLNLALAHLAADDKDAAANCCRRALSLAPHSPRAWCCLGEIEASRGREQEARAAYDEAMRLPSGAAPGALGLGHLLARRGDQEEALAVYEAALRVVADDARLHFAAGVALRALRRGREAAAAYRKALALRPNFPEVHLSLGNLLTDEGNFLGAAHAYRRAIALRPGYAKAHCNLGNALYSLGRHAEAARCYERAIALRPESAAARHNLGNTMLRRKDYLGAEACFRRLVELHPHRAEHHDALGNALLHQRRPAEAEVCYRRAIEIGAGFSAAHTNLANALLALGRREEMEHHYRLAVQLEPESPGGNYNLALGCLRKGNFHEGWRRHEWRWEFRELNLPRRGLPQPQWRGQTLDGETILLHAEQGLGDTIMFARYVPLVAARGGRVVLEVQPRLRRLLASMTGAAQVIARGDALPPFEHQCPMMSLPLAFDTRLESIPATVPYLSADPAEIAAAWRRCPRRDARLRVGLAWAGNPQMKGDPLRSTTLETFAPLLKEGGAVFFSLQFGEVAAEIGNSGVAIVDGCSRDRDLAETAALMATLDLVLSVDTSVAHLAGAMGLPVWVLLPHLADWRWMDHREDSPWYPTARLFRQPSPGDWTSLAAKLRDELADFAARFSPGRSLEAGLGTSVVPPQGAKSPAEETKARLLAIQHRAGQPERKLPSPSRPSECAVPSTAPR